MIRIRSVSAALRRDLVLSTVLFVVAVLVRLPNFMTVPALTDEFKEVGWALRSIEQNTVPLVAVDAYDGPLFAWLTSFAFRVFGQNLYLPRLLVLMLGALTVVATFFLAKELTRGDWRAGIFAALLLAFNAHHILFNSHVAWSNDITPMFATLSLVAYLRATRANRPAWLIPAAALYACAVQTHPSALALLPGFILDFLFAGSTRRRLRTVYPYLAALTALVVYSPVLYFNISLPLGSLTPASQATYAFESRPGLDKALSALGPTIAATGRVALGSMGPSTWESLWTDPALIIFLTGTIIALVWMIRRREVFPLLMIGPAVIFLATFNRFRAMPDSGRYFQILNPLIFSTWGALAFHLWDRARDLASRWRVGIARAALALTFCSLVIASSAELQNYYQAARSSGMNNESMLAMVENTRSDPNDVVLIEYQLNGLRTGRGGNVADDLAYLFQLDRHVTQFVSIGDPQARAGLRSLLTRSKSAYLISFNNVEEALGADFRLESLIRGRFPCPSCTVPNDFVLFRWENQKETVLDPSSLGAK